MNILRQNPAPATTDVRANHHHPSRQHAASRRAVGGGVAFLLLLLTMLTPASPASAEVSPNRFKLGEYTISVLPASNGDAEFVGTVSMHLELSNTRPDRIRMGVDGKLILNEPGCAKLRVSYLDADKNVVPGKVEHSELLSSPDTVEKVNEWSRHPDYRNVRLEVLYGPTCSSLTKIGQKTSNLSVEMSTLGDGERWVSGVAEDGSKSLIFNGGRADSILVRWDAATNPAPTPDRGDARITAVLYQMTPGCTKLQAKHYDASNGYLGTTWSEEVCGPVPTNVTLSNFASHADLHRISIRIRHRPGAGGPVSYSIARDFFLD